MTRLEENKLGWAAAKESASLFSSTERYLTTTDGYFVKPSLEKNVFTLFDPDRCVSFEGALIIIEALESNESSESKSLSSNEEADPFDFDMEELEQQILEQMDTEEIEDDVQEEVKPKKRGRPKGSRNKTSRVVDDEPSPSTKHLKCVGLKAYSMFQKGRRTLVHQQNPTLNFREISQEMGRLWKDLRREEKDVWFEKAREAMNTSVL